MKHVLLGAAAALALMLHTPAVAQDKPEATRVRLAVGGKSAIF